MNDITIKNRILTIRGQQVMIDRDLALLYEIETRALKQAVKRNKKRFPKDFMFVLTDDEVESMVSQNVIPSKKYFGGSLPYAFTEQGVANLASILKSDKAIQVNIQIMRAFVAMRKFIASNAQVFYRLENIDKKLLEHDNSINRIFKAIEDQSIKPKKGIFYDGQVFDAYKFACDLIRSAKERIILIDNYVDESTLTILSKKNTANVIIYTRINRQLREDIKKFNKQYPKATLVQFNKSHDRFLIIDNDVYHIGASLKDLGKKWFAFSRFDNSSIRLLERVDESEQINQPSNHHKQSQP